MGLIKMCGLYINLEGASSSLLKLCPCCRKPNPPKNSGNDPAAFLMEAAAAKTSVRRISRYSKMASDESLDERSETSSVSQDIKGIPGKKSWRRQARKWTKKTKKKVTLESRSSGEGGSKFEKCLKKKSKKIKPGQKETGNIEVQNLSNENFEIVEVNYNTNQCKPTNQFPKFKKSVFHQSLVDAKKTPANSAKPFAEVYPMPQSVPNVDWSIENHRDGAVSEAHLTLPPTSSKWRSPLSTKLNRPIRSRSPSPMYRTDPQKLRKIENDGFESQQQINPTALQNATDDDDDHDEDSVKIQETPNDSSDSANSNQESDYDDDGGSENYDESSDGEDTVSERGVNQLVGLSGLNNPVQECYGSVLISLQELDHKMLSVGIIEIRGIPWVGGIRGLMLEVGIPPKTQWLALPPGQGPRVPVNLKITLKIPREAREVQKPSSRRKVSKKWSSSDDSLYDGDVPLNMVRVSLWICGRIWRYGAIGHALVPLRLSVEQNPKPVLVGLYQQLEPSGDLGSLEIGLEFNYESSDVVLHLRILRANNLKPPKIFAIKGFGLTRRHDGHDIWCKISLWTEGQKVQKAVTPKVVFPVTCDPVFRSSSCFSINKDMLQNTCVVVKVISGRGITEEVLGKVVLGPLLYLGTTATPSSHPPPVALSHWGKAQNHPNEVNAWHKLYA